MNTQTRKPAGSAGSTGGQFAPTRAGEADVDLAPAQWVQDGVTPHPSGGYVTVRQDSLSVMYLGSDGRPHRLDGPAVERADGTRSWYRDGTRHRDDGPAIEHPDGKKIWCLNDRLHREDGPAVEEPDGTKVWYQRDRLHRVGGPAIEWADGTKVWYQNDYLHRDDGPAVERTDGYVGYWVHGCRLTQAEFAALPPASRV